MPCVSIGLRAMRLHDLVKNDVDPQYCEGELTLQSKIPESKTSRRNTPSLPLLIRTPICIHMYINVYI